MEINKRLLDDLSLQAKKTSRLRMNFDLRDSQDEETQRMLNALQPGTILPIHRHTDTSETVFVIRGKVKWIMYDDDGKVIDKIIVSPLNETYGLSIPPGRWHSLECLECDSVILSIKNGIWHPLTNMDILMNNNQKI